MKKLVYIFSLLLLACACNLQDFEPQTTRDTDKVRLSLSLSVPEAQSLTRAMGEQRLSSLHLVVFDQNGMFVEYATADNLKMVTENGTLYSFDVELTISDTPRSIHFVGNYTAAPKFGMETEVMTAMETKSGADAYWYRKTIAKIEADKDGAPTEDTKKAFGVIPLVRNFAKIVVTSSVSTEIFELDSYAIAGRPETGKVAAYNRTKGVFQDLVKTDGSMKGYDALTGEGYKAFSPTELELDFDLDDSESYSDFDNNEKYVYERETPLSNASASYVIVKGYFKDGNAPEGEERTPVYYKVNLRDNDGNYVPLLRNFQYTIKITSVNRDGYTDLEAAKISPGSGDISTHLEYIPLTNISNGDVRLSVDYTSKTLVTDKETVKLRVKFEQVRSAKLGAVEFKQEKKGKIDAAIQEVVKIDGPENGPGLYTYEVTPVALSRTQKTESLFIIGHYKINGSDTDLTISREVSYTLMEKKDMSAQCIPSEVPNLQGQEFDLQITIPDGLGESMFPLEFSIEAVKLSITPKNDNMPVSSGTSTIEADASGRVGKSSFWFVKTLSWEEYEPMDKNKDQPNSFLCHFATNMADSATDIYVSNPYFNQTSCTLRNYDDPNSFEDLEYQDYDDDNLYPIVDDTPVIFKFTTSARPSQDNITVTLTGLEPAKGDNLLTPAGKDANGNRKYTLVANDENSYTLNLVAADAYTDFNVKLEAYHFVTSQASAKRDRMNFSNLTLPKTQVGTENVVDFSFTYADKVVPVSIKLTNLKSNDSRLQWNGSEYVFDPGKSVDKTQTISLKTDSWGSKIGVKIVAAEGYNVPDPVTANRTLTATVNTGRRQTIIYYSFDNSLNTNSAIGSPRSEWDGNITISLSGDLGDDTRKMYFWYEVWEWGNWTTYLASTTLEALADGTATLNFQKQ